MGDKQREEFEEFWQGKILDAGWTLSKTESYFVWKRAWVSAITSVVVKLPDWSEYDTPRQAIVACSDRITEAGISYE